jgi:hypothetical protein
MPCEKYEEALIDLAASGSESVGVVLSHLERCASCRSYLERERVLFATIDCGVRQTTNAPLPTSLLQRFEARLAQETPAKLGRRLNWIFVASAAVALLAFTLLILRPRTAPERIVSRVMPEVSVQEKGPIGEKRGALALSLLPVTKRNVRQRNPRPTQPVARMAVSEGPEVLVSSEEHDAFAGFISRVAGRREVAIALVSPSPESVTKPLKVEDLQIGRLEIEPLREPQMSPISDK